MNTRMLIGTLVTSLRDGCARAAEIHPAYDIPRLRGIEMDGDPSDRARTGSTSR